jgi:hypothetical protein
VSIKSKLTVTKLPGGAVYIAGEPRFIGRLPVRPPDWSWEDDPEFRELMEAMEAVLHPKGSA